MLYGEALYELTNASFIPVNTKVPFQEPTATGLKHRYSVSAWDGRVFVQFSNSLYVLTVDTQTWATWTSDVCGPVGRVFSIALKEDDEPYAYHSSALSSKGAALYRITRDASLDAEAMECTVRTKIYDYQVSSAWKRLMFWGADVSAPGTVSANVAPIVYGRPYAWNEMIFPWNSPLVKSWALGRDESIEVSDTAVITSASGSRKFIKWLKSLRFRQVYFELVLRTDGSVLTGPAKLFTLTTRVGVKQLVAKKIN